MSENTLIKMLKAYKDTLLVVERLNKKSKEKHISNNLEKNLRKHKVPQSTIQKILEYDLDYKKKLVKKDITPKKKLKKRRNSKQKYSKNSQTIADNSAYLLQIIKFSYRHVNNKNEIEHFIKTINNRKKILSDSLIRNIILAYKETLNKSKNLKERKRSITDTLEQHLLRRGVHPDTIEVILQLDPNYNNGSVAEQS